MNNKNIVSILLILTGLIVLAYSGLSFSLPGKTVAFLGLHFATTDHYFISPAIGLIMLLGGIVLLLIKSRSSQ